MLLGNPCNDTVMSPSAHSVSCSKLVPADMQAAACLGYTTPTYTSIHININNIVQSNITDFAYHQKKHAGSWAGKVMHSALRRQHQRCNWIWTDFNKDSADVPFAVFFWHTVKGMGYAYTWEI